jgi:hypothetical protein
MKRTAAQLKYILIALLSFMSAVAFAQNKFKKGEEIERHVLVRSNCVLQRGSQALHITSSSVIKKSYKVTDADEKGISFAVSTDMLSDTVNAMEQKLIYNSNKTADPNSAIQTGLQRLVSGKAAVIINNKGEILSAKQPTAVGDTLLSFTGIQPDNLAPGKMLPFMVGLPANSLFKKGYSWTVNTASSQTTYTIYAANVQVTIITYKTSQTGGSLNSRINGSMLISNDTGLILKCSSQSVSVGYEMVNGVVYAATRRTAVTEVNIKK